PEPYSVRQNSLPDCSARPGCTTPDSRSWAGPVTGSHIRPPVVQYSQPAQYSGLSSTHVRPLWKASVIYLRIDNPGIFTATTLGRIDHQRALAHGDAGQTAGGDIQVLPLQN